MSGILEVKKVLIGAEDLALGSGTVTQQRGGVNTTITKLNLPLVFSSVDEIKAVDYTKTKYVYLGIPGTSAVAYYYSASSSETADNDNYLLPASSVGRWVKFIVDASNVKYTPSGTGVLATYIKAFLDKWVLATSFGLSTDATASVNTAAIHAAATEAAIKNTNVLIPGGSYACNPLTIPTRASLVGPTYTAGNLNRQAARLDFSALGASTKAITVGSDITLQNLVISGPGDSVSGTYGVYGGLLASEELGAYTTLIGCTVEDFETNVVLSRWINTIERCMIDDSITGIRLNDQANATKIINNVVTVGNSSGRKNILVAGGIGIEITHNTSEAAFQHIVVQGGRKISINNNYFEQANGGFIDIEGSGTPAADREMTVNLHDNNYNEYGASASTSTRYGIRVQRGNVSIHDETIGEYDSVANTGLRYGIRLGNIQTDGGFGGLHIGSGMRIGAHTPIEQAVIGTAQRKLITTPWCYTKDITMSGSGWDVSANIFDTPVEDGIEALNYIRQASLFAYSALDADITYMSLGYYSSTNLSHAYIQSNFNFGGTITAGTRVIATDSNYTSLGKSIFEKNNARAFRVDRNQGSATSGSVMFSVEIGEIRYYNIST